MACFFTRTILLVGPLLGRNGRTSYACLSKASPRDSQSGTFPLFPSALLVTVDAQSVTHRSARNKDIASNFRAFFAQSGPSEATQTLQHDMHNVLTFMQSQREYKVSVLVIHMVLQIN